jgi:PleD family two-component response regulator
VSCSYGIAQDRDALSMNELIGLADAALYAAKETGRDKIVIAK